LTAVFFVFVEFCCRNSFVSFLPFWFAPNRKNLGIAAGSNGLSLVSVAICGVFAVFGEKVKACAYYTRFFPFCSIAKNNRERSAKLQSMDRYQRVEKPRAETPISENEIRVTTQGKMRNYITYATTLLQVLGLTGPLLPFCLFIVVVALFFLSKIFLCLTHFSPRLQVLPLCISC
jgi:hypothetical protein